MTHEHFPHAETGGPEEAGWLPDAETIPGDLSPEDSDGPALGGDI